MVPAFFTWLLMQKVPTIISVQEKEKKEPQEYIQGNLIEIIIADIIKHSSV